MVKDYTKTKRLHFLRDLLINMNMDYEKTMFGNLKKYKKLSKNFDNTAYTIVNRQWHDYSYLVDAVNNGWLAEFNEAVLYTTDKGNAELRYFLENESPYIPKKERTLNDLSKRIQIYINYCNYTYTVNDIYNEFMQKYWNHFYTSYTMKDIFKQFESELKQYFPKSKWKTR